MRLRSASPHALSTRTNLSRWYEQHAQAVWHDAEQRPSLQETRDHAKGLSRVLIATRGVGSSRGHRYPLRSQRSSSSNVSGPARGSGECRWRTSHCLSNTVSL